VPTASERLLVVDDEATIRRVLQRFLTDAGYQVLTAANGREALETVSRGNIEAVLLDIKMPVMSGMEVLRELAPRWPDLCAVMITSVDDTKTAIEAMKLGAYDYITKPFERDTVILALSRTLEKRRLLLENREYQQHLEEKVEEQTQKIRASFLNAMTSLAYALEARDEYTSGHSRRVADISVAIARELGLSPENIDGIRQAALVHDIGKIGVRETILNKPTRLTREELQHIYQHPEIGERILSPVAENGDILRPVRHHHERYNGTGYPDRIKGEQIPLEARILAVADAYDAMTSERPYRNAMSEQTAINELEKGKETQFDPGVVEAFLKSRDGINSYGESMR
jgi:putative two-component system response regulator